MKTALIVCVIGLLVSEGLARTVTSKDHNVHKQTKRQSGDGTMSGSTGSQDAEGLLGPEGSRDDPMSMDGFQSYDDVLAELQTRDRTLYDAFTGKDLSSLPLDKLKDLPGAIMINCPADILATLTKEQIVEILSKVRLPPMALRRIVFAQGSDALLNPTTGLLKAIKDKLAEIMGREMPPEEIDDERLQEIGDREQIEELDDEMSMERFEPMPLAAMRALLGAVQQSTDDGFLGPMTAWDTTKFQRLGVLLAGITSDDVEQIPRAVFNDVIAILQEHSRLLEPMTKMKLLDRFKRINGAPSTWTEDILIKLGKLFSRLTGMDCEQISAPMIKDNIARIGKLKFPRDSRCPEKLVRKLVAENYDFTVPDNLAKLGRHLIKHLPNDVANDALAAIVAALEGDPTNAQLQHMKDRFEMFISDVARKDMCSSVRDALLPQDGNVRPQDLTSTQVEEAFGSAPVAGCENVFTAEDFRNMNRQGLCEAAKNGNFQDLTREQARHVVDSIRECDGQIGRQQIEQLGAVGMRGVGTNDIRNIPVDDLAEEMEIIATAAREMRPATRREIVRQLFGGGQRRGNMTDLNRELFQAFPNRMLKEQNIDDLIEAATETEFDNRQARYIFRQKFKDQNEISEDDVRGMGSAAAGMRRDDFDKISDDQKLGCIAAMEETGRGNMRCRQKREIAKEVLLPRLQELSTTDCPLDGLSIAEAASMAETAMQLPLDTFDVSNCDASILETLLCSFGELDKSILQGSHPRANRRRIAKKILALKGVETSGTIGTEVLECLGNLEDSLEAEDIARIDGDALEDRLPNMKKHCLGRDIKQAVVDRLLEAKETTLDDLAMQELYNDLALLVPKDKVEEMDADALQYHMVNEEALDNEMDDDSKFWCGHDRTEDDNTDEREQKQELVRRAAEGDADAYSVTSKRRRRSTSTTPTSDILVNGGEGNLQFTADQLSSMTGETFLEAIENLGVICGWSDEQEEALLAKAKETDVWGSDITAWDSAQNALLGCIAKGFSHSDLSTMNLDDNDDVYSMAQHAGWNTAQTQAALNRYLSQTSKTTDALISSDMVSLAHFMCGMSPSDMGNLDSTELQYAIGEVGQHDCFTVDQLKAMLAHMKSEYGNTPSAWEEEDINEMGVVIAALTSSEMQALSDAQRQAIDPVAFSVMQSEVLQALTPDQLNVLDMLQALLIPNSSLSGLSGEQRDAILAAQYNNEEVPSTTDDSGVSATTFSAITMVMATMAALLTM